MRLLLPAVPRLLSSLFRGLLFIVSGLAVAIAQTSDAGAVRGTITNDATGAFVEGAAVTLESIPSRSDVTDSQGSFFIGGVAPGKYRIRVESAGYTMAEISVTIPARDSQTVAIALKSDIISLEPLMVTAQAEGQAQSLNLQRNAENIRNRTSTFTININP